MSQKSGRRPVTLQDLIECLGPLCDLLDGVLPFEDGGLLPGERMKLGGHLFPEAEPLVRAVAAGLAQDRDAFPDIPLDPRGMTGAQELAIGYRKLHRGLLLFAQGAHDQYVKLQAELVQASMDTIRQVRQGRGLPFRADPELPERRRLALLRAEKILRQRTERNQKKGQRRKAAEPAAPEGRAAAPKQTAQEKAMKQVRSKERRALLEAVGRRSLQQRR